MAYTDFFSRFLRSTLPCTKTAFVDSCRYRWGSDLVDIRWPSVFEDRDLSVDAFVNLRDGRTLSIQTKGVWELFGHFRIPLELVDWRGELGWWWKLRKKPVDLLYFPAWYRGQGWFVDLPHFFDVPVFAFGEFREHVEGATLNLPLASFLELKCVHPTVHFAPLRRKQVEQELANALVPFQEMAA